MSNLGIEVIAIVPPVRGAGLKKPLRQLEPPGGLDPSRGVATPSYSKSENTSGIDSPLTETAYEDREYHPEVILTSSDGLLTIPVRRVKKIHLTDANDRDVQIVLKAPAA